MLHEKYRKIYEIQPAQAIVAAESLKRLIATTDWEMIMDGVDAQINAYRSQLESALPENIREIQYAVQNLRNLKQIPLDIVKDLENFNLSSPPKKGADEFEFEYTNNN